MKECKPICHDPYQKKSQTDAISTTSIDGIIRRFGVSAISLGNDIIVVSGSKVMLNRGDSLL
jgi:hypothetical protein